MGWLLRTAALVSLVASALGSVIVPGLLGLTSDAVITRWERISAGVGNLMALLLLALLLTGALDLMRVPHAAGTSMRGRTVNIGARAMIFFGASGVVAMLLPSFLHPLTTFGSVLLVGATLFVVLGGSAAGLRAPHTRALAVMQLALAFAGACRILGWGIGMLATDSLRMYAMGRTFSAAGIIGEGIAMSVCVTWLSTRRRWLSSIAVAIAMVAAFMVVWVVSRAELTSPAWENTLRSGISHQVTPGVAAALRALESFFVAASIFVALACACTPRQLGVVVCGFALALLGRGAYDVPLRALAASVAALWTALAAVDERAMWRSLRPDPAATGKSRD